MTIFFSVSKLIWILLSPGNLLALIVALGVFLLWVNKVKVAKIIFSVVLILLCLVTFLPTGNLLIYPLENRFPMEPELPEKIHGIIVLSGAVGAKATALTGQVQVNEQVDRELAFMKLARRYPEAKLLYSGGSSSLTHQQFKGADAGRQLLSEQGIDLARVVFERDSRNTSESALLSKQIINPSIGENWILITTAWHMPRSVGVFCSVGWPVVPYPVDYRVIEPDLFSFDFQVAASLLKFEVGLKEWIGLFAYWISDRIPSFLPDRC